MSAHLTYLCLFVYSSPSVDTVRLSLELDSARWFGWLVRSSIIVGIGVALEAPEATMLLKRWYRLWRGKDVEPTSETSWVIPIAYLGLVLVVGGVIGEGTFEFLSAQSETALRSHDEHVLGDTESKFGQIKDSAEAAATAASQADESAKGAVVELEKAIASAGKAMALAKDARREADSFDQRIVYANETAAEAESHLADALRRAAHAEQQSKDLRSPRSLTDVSSFKQSLLPFKGTEYMFNVFPNEESVQFLKSLNEVLLSAGWVRKAAPYHLGISGLKIFPGADPQNLDSVPECTVTGISVSAHSPESLDVIRTTPWIKLSKDIQSASALWANIPKHVLPLDEHNAAAWVNIDPGSTTDPIVICVGQKP